MHTSTLKGWCDKHPEFEQAYETARQLQRNIWMVNSLAGHYNSSFAQFFGKYVLGYGEERVGDSKTVEIVVRVEE